MLEILIMPEMPEILIINFAKVLNQNCKEDL